MKCVRDKKVKDKQRESHVVGRNRIEEMSFLG